MKANPSPKAKDKSLELLRGKGLNVTHPRRKILAYLLDHHGPFSVEEIHQSMGEGFCDLATVYRCLGQFEKKGLVERRYFGDDILRYEYLDHAHHHHHIICTQCKAVTQLDDCDIAKLESMVKDRCYRDVSHTLEFFGVCAKCQP